MVACKDELKWKVIDKYVCASECSKYRLIKAYIDKTVRYVPYFMHPDKPVMLSNGVLTVEAAKTICETHNKTRTAHAIRETGFIRPTETPPTIAAGSDGKEEQGTAGD